MTPMLRAGVFSADSTPDAARSTFSAAIIRLPQAVQNAPLLSAPQLEHTAIYVLP